MNLRDSLILLGATAATSGFLVPFILKRIDAHRGIEEKDRELRRARRDKLVEAQAIFLDRLTEKLWKWRYIFMRVAYYGGVADEHSLEQAREAYGTQFWGILNDIRVELSRSRRLVSPEVLDALREFYDQIVAWDRLLLTVSNIKDPVEKKLTYMDLNHKIFGEVSDG
jgi:hypothetical protein